MPALVHQEDSAAYSEPMDWEPIPLTSSAMTYSLQNDQRHRYQSSPRSMPDDGALSEWQSLAAAIDSDQHSISPRDFNRADTVATYAFKDSGPLPAWIIRSGITSVIIFRVFLIAAFHGYPFTVEQEDQGIYRWLDVWDILAFTEMVLGICAWGRLCEQQSVSIHCKISYIASI